MSVKIAMPLCSIRQYKTCPTQVVAQLAEEVAPSAKE